jgi:hemolysin
VAGSTVKAGGALTADAAGDVNVHSTQNSHDSSSTTETRGFDAYAKEQTPEQYRAGVHYRQAADRHPQRRQPARLQPQRRQCAGEGRRRSDDQGGEVKSTAGDTTLGGKTCRCWPNRTATKLRPTPQHRRWFLLHRWPRPRRSGVDFAHSTTQDSSSKTTAQTTSVQSSGGLNLNADKLVTEGAQVKAGNGLNVAANEIDNRAASNTESSSHNQSNWSADIGANVGHRTSPARLPVRSRMCSTARCRTRKP